MNRERTLRSLKEVLNSMKECKSAVQNCTEIEIVLKKCWTIWVSPSQIGFCNCKNIKMYDNFGKSGCTLMGDL